MATTGADADLSRFVALSRGSRRDLAAGVRTNVTRSGWLFRAVGVNRAKS